MKVIHYNPYLSANLPDNCIEQYRDFLNPNYKSILEKQLRMTRIKDSFFRSFQTTIDRTGKTEHFYNIDVLYPVPKWNLEKKFIFEDLCDERTIALLNENKKINIYWSGGLDSTNVLFSFLKHKKHKDQIVVQMNYNTILESGYVFETFIKDEFEYTIKTMRLDNITFNPDELYVTGHVGDQLLGDDGRFVKATMLDNSIYTYLDELSLEYYSSVIKDFFPFEIKTARDFMWFFMMNYRYQGAALATMFLTRNNNLGINYSDVIKPFYDTENFQQWSIQQYCERQYEKLNAKQYLRDYILKIGGNEIKDYVVNKKRTASAYINYSRNYLLTTENFENIYVSDDVVKQVYNKRK